MSSSTALPFLSFGEPAHTRVLSPTPTTIIAKRFVCTAIIMYVLGLSLLAVFSIYANPWGNYGEVGFLDPQEYNDRLVKTKYLDALQPGRRPRALVFGSSSMMSMRGSDIERAVGMSAFNAYVSGGRADDYLCLLRHLVMDLHHRPELLVIGLETWTFGPPAESWSIIPGARCALINVPQLIQHHPRGQWYRCAWAKAVDLFSRDQLAASWRALFKENRPRAALLELGSGIIALDGALVYADNDPMKLAGRSHTLGELRRTGVTTLLKGVIDRGETDQLERLVFYRFDGLWTPRVERFEELLRLCEQVQTKVVFVHTPLHPLAWKMLEAHPQHGRNVAELDALVVRWQREFSMVLGTIDASHIENYDGEAADFYDEMHCGPQNSQRILKKLAGFLAAL